LVVLLQVLLLAGYFYLADQEALSIEPAELMLLLSYSAMIVGLAIIVGVIRHRWMQSENRIRHRLLDVIDAIPDPSGVRDMKGKYIMWNKAAEAYHGIKAEHVLGKTPFELFPEEVASSILALDAQCVQTNQTVVRRVVLPPIYGKGQRITTIRVAPVHSASDSGVRGVVTILHDVTDSEREAANLRHLSTQLKMALDTSGFGSWIWDLDNDWVTYSAQYQALLRYEGRSFNQDFEFLARIHPGDAKAVVAAAKRGLKDNVPFDQVYRLRCFDEVYRYFHASGEAAFDDKGRRFFAGLLCPLDRSAD
jgi:PAS domain S-box-containing protein